jgi:hypothetical protein
MALKNRSDYEVVLQQKLFDLNTVMRIYPQGMSLDWMLEHLVRREALNLRYTYPPTDPSVRRPAKDKVIIKR